MSKISDIFKNFFLKNFGKLALITSITTLNSSNKFSVKLSVLIIILMILKVFTSKNILSNILNNNDITNETENIIIENDDDIDNIDISFNIDENIDENISKHKKPNEEFNDINIEKHILRNKKQDEECNHIKNDIKNNIKLIYKKINESEIKTHDPYTNNKNTIEKNYKNEDESSEFILNVNSNTCSTPIFNMRKYHDIDYYHNFILHDFNPKKINNLIMCKDIHKWMSTSSLSDEDLPDDLIPIYYIKKINDSISVYEYLRIFVHTDEDETRNALVQKGVDYLHIENDINELIHKGLIKDLLSSKKYINYNLSSRDGICSFLDKFLSHVLLPEQYIGEIIHLDINNYIENKQTYEYHLNTINSDLNGFNTTI